MTQKRFRKLVRAYYTKMNMEHPNMQMNMKILYEVARSCKIQHSVKLNYNESMYQHIYDVITLKVEP